MALIECPECKKEVADSAKACPNCGAPISSGDAAGRYCKSCKRKTIHVAPNTSHILHLLLSVISAGIWVPVWLIIFLNNKTKSKCTVCGRMVGITG